MSGWLLALVGIIYLFVAFDMLRSGNMGLALAYLFYALSNVGLYMASVGK